MESEQNTVVVSVFMDRDLVPSALDELRQAGCADDQIGLMMGAETPTAAGQKVGEVDNRAQEGAVAGVTGGSALAALVGATKTSLIPELGPVLSAGVLGAAGATVGSALGALAAVGIPEEDAHFYLEDVKSGRIVLMVRTGGMYEEVVNVLRRHNPHRPPSVRVRADNKLAASPKEPSVVASEDETRLPEKVLNARAGRVPASHVHQFEDGRCVVCGWVQLAALAHHDSGPLPSPGQHT